MPTDDNTNRIAGLEELLRSQAGKAPAPVEQWDPPYCGDIGMRVRADGVWLYQGSPIGRIALVNDLPNAINPVLLARNRDDSPVGQITNLHVHSFHVSPKSPSDDVFLDMAPGTTFHYESESPTNHSTGTYWYHPHRHVGAALQQSYRTPQTIQYVCFVSPTEAIWGWQ